MSHLYTGTNSPAAYLQQAALAERARNQATPAKTFVQGIRITPATHGHLHELGASAVRAKLREAEEQLTYWSGAKARALTERDRDAAAARITIWQREVRAITARLQQLAAA